MELHLIGFDLGKTVFHLVGLNHAGEVVVRKKFSRTQLLRFTANLEVDLIGMEACAGSHFLGKAAITPAKQAARAAVLSLVLSLSKRNRKRVRSSGARKPATLYIRHHEIEVQKGHISVALFHPN